jgi:uncharacterized protein YndB with AHSA1/START domain
VLEVKPFTKLIYSWLYNSANTKVEWTLVPKGNGTELQLVHSGFVILEDLNLHNGGWISCGNKLTGLLNPVKA